MGRSDGRSAEPRYLIDTCIVVDHLRGYVDAYEWFKRITIQN